jgi:hypothetical protein
MAERCRITLLVIFAAMSGAIIAGCAMAPPLPVAAERDATAPDAAPATVEEAPPPVAVVRVPAAPAKVLIVEHRSAAVPAGPRRGGCGSRGGPGYRTASGRCASWQERHRGGKH